MPVHRDDRRPANGLSERLFYRHPGFRGHTDIIIRSKSSFEPLERLGKWPCAVAASAVALNDRETICDRYDIRACGIVGRNMFRAYALRAPLRRPLLTPRSCATKLLGSNPGWWKPGGHVKGCIRPISCLSAEKVNDPDLRISRRMAPVRRHAFGGGACYSQPLERKAAAI